MGGFLASDVGDPSWIFAVMKTFLFLLFPSFPVQVLGTLVVVVVVVALVWKVEANLFRLYSCFQSGLVKKF